MPHTQGLVYYGLATEAGLPEDVTDTLVPVKLGEGAGTTAAADTVAYERGAPRLA